MLLTINTLGATGKLRIGQGVIEAGGAAGAVAELLPSRDDVPVDLPASQGLHDVVAALSNRARAAEVKHQSQHGPHHKPVTVAPPTTTPRTGSIHVCFCTDDKDLRPLVVAINSSMANAKSPKRLLFHIITTPKAAELFNTSIRRALPAARIVMHHDAGLQARIQGLVDFRKSSQARKGLASPFNFAPFYLHSFLAAGPPQAEGKRRPPRRLIYLDTDVVLTGDLGQLESLDLHGHAVAAVEDCLQHFDIYVDFKQLRALGLERPGIDPKACVFNRGIFVVDVPRWQELRLTEEIEEWMGHYRGSKKDLYKFGMSQPPWLLAIRGRYQHLGPEWNCRGLGREFLDTTELAGFKARGFGKAQLNALGSKPQGPRSRPYVSRCAGAARLLHFNGALKPWLRKKWGASQLAPLCALPAGAAVPVTARRAGNMAFVECTTLWWAYADEAAVQALDLRAQAP